MNHHKLRKNKRALNVAKELNNGMDKDLLLNVEMTLVVCLFGCFFVCLFVWVVNGWLARLA